MEFPIYFTSGVQQDLEPCTSLILYILQTYGVGGEAFLDIVLNGVHVE